MKRLIVCCDGTWNSEEEAVDVAMPDGPDGQAQDRQQLVATNVWRLYKRIASKDGQGVEQRAFYQPGVGSNPSHSALRRSMTRIAGGAFGQGLNDNILEAYCWLVREYKPGDELWLFGFSRGAYTARSLAGLIRNCGILRPAHQGMADRAMALYRARDDSSHPDAPQSASFRRNYAYTVEEIHCVGVWDTVGALGIPAQSQWLKRRFNRRHMFHDVKLSSRVQHAFHAVAIDERRRAFKPSLWEITDPKQDVQQVWFIGVHSDVGGGYQERELSDVALTWMMSRAAGCGLAFLKASEVVVEPGVDDTLRPDPSGQVHDSRWLPHRLVPFLLAPHRSIAADGHQCLHCTAHWRAENDKDYPSEELKKALKGDVPVCQALPGAMPEHCALGAARR